MIRVRSSYTGGVVGTPKNRERRDVDLISDVVELLSAGETAKSLDDDLVFPGDERPAVSLADGSAPSAPLSGDGCGRDPTGRADAGEADVPQLQAHFAKRALENGAQITWLSRHLGHSSLKVTTDIYGHWERAERKLQAAKMEGAFPV